jgi:hypothetical protein
VFQTQELLSGRIVVFRGRPISFVCDMSCSSVS